MVNRELIKGHLDVMLLAAVRGASAHGYAIIQAIKDSTRGQLDLAEGTIYPALHRLEQSKLLVGRWATVGGRRRRVYRLTRRGEVALSKRAAEWRGFSRLMDALLKGA